MKQFFFDRALDDPTRVITLCDQKGKPLCKGLLKEVPTFTLSNSWSDGGGLLSKLVDMASSALRSGGSDIDRVLKSAQKDESLLGSIINKIPHGKDILQGASVFRNASIKSIDSLVKQYNGTSSSPSDLEMTVWYFADQVGSKDPRSALGGIIAATTGAYISDSTSVDTIKELVDRATDATGGGFSLTTEDIKTAADAIGKVAGIQLAPNGYQIDPAKGISGNLCGTFELMVGNIMRIKNIVVSNLSFQISPYHIAELVNGELVDTGVPSWTSIDLTFELAREFTPNDIKSLLTTVS